MARDRHPSCVHCRYFQVTWETGHPRACLAYGIKGTEYPSVVVLRESGIPCQLYEARLRAGKGSTTGKRR